MANVPFVVFGLQFMDPVHISNVKDAEQVERDEKQNQIAGYVRENF